MRSVVNPLLIIKSCTKNIIKRSSQSRLAECQNPNVFKRCYSSHIIKDGRPFRMAVIGSGPAGFYTAYKVMSSIENAVVDMYEHLPVPFGLVRFGVAPDHPEVKNCQDKFEEVAASPRFNFIGNVDVGPKLPLKLLANHYNAILFAYGATKDRKLGIPGEDNLKGIYAARDFVAWYNGLPGHATLEPDLESGDVATVIGQGNVALDVARVLLSGVDRLRKTDMTEYALATLPRSRVKRVHVVGRRGPMQASFTIKEVRELFNLPSVYFEPIDSALLPSDVTMLPRASKRFTQLLLKGSPTSVSQAQKSWSLDFLRSPKSFNASSEASNDLSSITFMDNVLQGPDIHSSTAQVTPTTKSSSIQSSLAFRSIGYKSEPIDGMQDIGINFDSVTGVIPNDTQGRITRPQKDGVRLPGMYCSGWVKRGPAGVIANTMEDAFGTAEAIARDWQGRQPFLAGGQGWDALKDEADRRGLRRVSWHDWRKIDAVERERGRVKGKEREKFASVEDMLRVLE